MHVRKKRIEFLLGGVLIFSGCGRQDIPIEEETAAATIGTGDRVVAVSANVVGGKNVVERKILTAAGYIVPESAGDVPPVSVVTGSGHIGAALDDLLNRPDRPDTIEVDLLLVPVPQDPQPVASGTARGDVVTLNGRRVTPQELADDAAMRATAAATRRNQRTGGRHRQISSLNAREILGLSREALNLYAETEGPLTLRLPSDRIRAIVTQNSDLISGADLHPNASDESLSTAMAATSTTSLPFDSRGVNVGIYMTETGCPPTGFISNYTLLYGSNTDHARNVSSILRAVSPSGWVYCRGGATLPSSSDLSRSPVIRVVTRSNISSVTNTSPYGTTTAAWDDWVYNNSILIVNAAGNNGTVGGGIGEPAGGLNVLTVGNYNDGTSTINSSSSFLDPVTKNAKPELSAPGMFIDAGGFTMSGTSQATPFVSAIGADLIAAYSWLQLRPHLLKSTLLAAATDPISGDFGSVGLGGIDHWSGYDDMGGFWWEGATFAYWDSIDPIPNNGTLEADIGIDASQEGDVRVTIAWATRGTWTVNHKSDAHPMGMDLDLTILDPNGTAIGSSSSYDSPFESVSFQPTMSGTYRARITQFALRDTSATLRIGLTRNARY